jgi:GDP-L-fucose synthase
MTKVLVVGGYGFLGTHVARAFAQRGYAVEVCSRRSGVDVRELCRIQEFLERIRPDVVINCAAHVGGIAYNAQCPVAICEDNLVIGLNMVKASAQCGVRKFVNIMPNCTYPGIAEVYTEPQWWDGPMHPTVVAYGMPRKALWVLTWAYKMERRFESSHLVLPNLYGPHDHFDVVRSHALGALIKKVVAARFGNDPMVEVWGSGAPVREWMYVEDAAEGIRVATEMSNDLEIMNLGSGKGCSIRDLAELIKKVVGWKGDFVFDRSRPDGAPKKILDVTKMRRVLDWFPKVELEDGIARTVEWYVQHRQEYQ